MRIVKGSKNVSPVDEGSTYVIFILFGEFPDIGLSVGLIIFKIHIWILEERDIQNVVHALLVYLLKWMARRKLHFVLKRHTIKVYRMVQKSG
jgi:hypothetical protein